MSQSVPKAKSQYLILGFVSAAILFWPAIAAESDTTIPDLTGLWARNSFAYETPAVGLGPVSALSRHPWIGTHDSIALD